MPDSATPPPHPSGEATPPSGDALVGVTLLGRVKVLRAIARGGMGRVYLGEQTRPRRRCAVKVLDPALAARRGGEDFAKRFFLEASVVAKLAHPNVVTIFDYGETPDGGCFIAMEYLEGRSLADELRAGAIAPPRAVTIALQIGAALQAAHALGVVHRDVKPGNVFLVPGDDGDDLVKVLDFGLLKDNRGAEGHDLPQGDLVMGSPRYMAPEQVQGKDVDARTDVYSLGATLYAMLAGRPPFERRTELATMLAQVSDEPPPLREAAPGVALPGGLGAIVMKCLAKSPDARWASMSELASALRGGAPVPVVAQRADADSPVSTGEAGARAASKALEPASNRGPAVVAALALGCLAAAVIGLSLRSAPPPPLPAAAPPAPPPLATATLHVETVPPGAKVKEEGDTLCASTPCDIVYTGSAADPATEHLIALLLPGYKLERKIATTAAPIRVTLTKSK